MIHKLLNRAYWLRNKLTKNPFIDNLDYARHFAEYNQKITEVTGKKIEPLFDLRCREVFEVVKKYQIKTIMEMGTGRTTFLFNSLPGLDVTSYEQDELWQSLILGAFKDAELTAPKIVVSEVEYHKEGGRYTDLQITTCDLLYIDGPYVARKAAKPFRTHTGKPAYYDFETLFDNSVFPKVIMIEGRTDTADAILASQYANKYTFSSEFLHASQRRNWSAAMGLRRHSTFIRQDVA